MYTNGMGFCALERVKGIHHTTIIHWLKQLGSQLCAPPELDIILAVTELDELETFLGKKKIRSGSGQRLTTFQSAFWLE